METNEEEAKIILMVGPPCSGKSTWSKSYLKEHPKAVRINRDDLRIMLSGKPMSDYRIEEIVSAMVTKGLDQAILLHRTVIVDQTNCRLKYINWFIEKYGGAVEIEFQVFDVELKELLRRNQMRAISTRVMPISEDIITKFHADFQVLKKNFKFETIKGREYDE